MGLVAANTSTIEGRSWVYVTRRFTSLIENLAISAEQGADGERKHAGIRTCLNRHYHGYPSDSANSMLVGSWGKQLRVRPPRDIDVLFVLPWVVYHRFEGRTGNKQTQLLQEVKGVLAQTYSQTDLRGDGQAVVVNFATMPVEVVLAFPAAGGQYWICDTTWGGSYRLTDPNAELGVLGASDNANFGVTRHLIRMMKQWQRHCNVPLRSFQIERLAVEFLRSWTHTRDMFWYDWLIRDFLEYLVAQAGCGVVMPGTGQLVWLGENWVGKARDAHRAAVTACDYERSNENLLAGLYWQDIFGDMIPVRAS